MPVTVSVVVPKRVLDENRPKGEPRSAGSYVHDTHIALIEAFPRVQRDFDIWTKDESVSVIHLVYRARKFQCGAGHVQCFWLCDGEAEPVFDCETCRSRIGLHFLRDRT